MWLRLNSAGPVQRHLRPDRVEVPAQRGAAQPGVGLLQRVGRLGVPPDHDVGVGPQARDVVDAADDDVLAGQLVEQRRHLVGDGGRAVVAERPGQPEHRPHRVADGGVQLVRPLADAALRRSALLMRSCLRRPVRGQTAVVRHRRLGGRRPRSVHVRVQVVPRARRGWPERRVGRAAVGAGRHPHAMAQAPRTARTGRRIWWTSVVRGCHPAPQQRRAVRGCPAAAVSSATPRHHSSASTAC